MFLNKVPTKLQKFFCAWGTFNVPINPQKCNKKLSFWALIRVWIWNTKDKWIDKGLILCTQDMSNWKNGNNNWNVVGHLLQLKIWQTKTCLGVLIFWIRFNFHTGGWIKFFFNFLLFRRGFYFTETNFFPLNSL